MKVFVNQIRTYKKDHTISEVFLPNSNSRFCYALEDVGRAGAKVPKETCIPEGCYRLKIRFSDRFKKELVAISNMPDGSVNRHGKVFTGVLIHGGNKVTDTEGCPLYAYNYIADGTVQYRASDAFLEWVHKQDVLGNEVYLVISSTNEVLL